MSHQAQLLGLLDAAKVPYERNPGGSGETIKVPDHGGEAGSGYAEWRFDFAGNLEWVKHYA